jgi:hypothetical protein
VDQCKLLRFPDACRMVDYWRQCADAEGSEDEAERLRAGRYASVAKTIDGVVDVRALLDPVGGAAFKAELDRLERQLYLADKKSGTVRTNSQRRADALVEMAQRSRTSKPGGLRPRPLITVLIGENVDHKRPYSEGGETSQENGEIECRPHNRDKLKHDKKPRRRDPPEQRPPPTD